MRKENKWAGEGERIDKKTPKNHQVQEDQGNAESLSAERAGEMGKKQVINLVKHSRGKLEQRKKEGNWSCS